MSKDFYGDNKRFFIGKVKDISDPMNSGRVRVRIFGIHPDEGDTPSVVPTESSSSGSSSGGGGNVGGSGSSSGGGGTKAPISVDESKLPNATQLSMKVSKHFTLGQLTVDVTGPHARSSSRKGIEQGKLTKEIISNLARLALNCLDPLKDQYPNMVIHGAWRVGYSKADTGTQRNHPSGFACDFHIPGRSVDEVKGWIANNLKGRFNTVYYYGSFLHIQLGTNVSYQGSLENPRFIHGAA